MRHDAYVRLVARTGLALACAVAFASAALAAAAPLDLSSAVALATAPPPDEAPVLRLGLDDAVKSALEHNLDLQVQRLNPEAADFLIAQMRNSYAPTLTSRLFGNGRTDPPSSFLVGLEPVRNRQVQSRFGLQQYLQWGGGYSVTWDASRNTTNSIFTNFNPSVASNLNVAYSQPFLRNFSIDATRQQILVLRKNREISDVQLRQTVVQTIAAVKIAYWDLVYAIESLDVQRKTLDVAQALLKNNRLKVEVGTMAPIDVVEAESEVAKDQETVIVAESAIRQAEDRLRALVLDPDAPNFWNLRIAPTDQATFEARPVDTAALIRAALDKRTDLSAAKKNLEAQDVTIRYLRNQLLPDVRLDAAYNATGIGGTEFERTGGFPGTIVGTSQKSFGSVLGEVVSRDFPTWTLAVNVSYPLGTSVQDANLARARVQYNQAQTQMKSLEVQIVSQVRDVARQVETNAKRVEASRAARELAERRFEAEQKKFNVGMSTSFFVVQAQRDLAQARNGELNAVLAYDKSLVNLEAVQEANISSAGSGITVTTGQTLGGSSTFGTTTSTFGTGTSTGAIIGTTTTFQPPQF